MKNYAIIVGLAVALILGVAGVFTGLITAENLSTQNKAYAQQDRTYAQQQVSLRAQVALLREQLSAAQNPKQAGVSAEIAHMGMCVGFDQMTGDVNAVAPATVMSGVPSCPSGSFISVVPQG